MAENETGDAIQADIEALRNELRELAEDIRTTSRQHAREGAAQARHAYEDVRAEACDRTRQLSSEIQANPYTAVFTAVGIGVILGRLLGR